MMQMDESVVHLNEMELFDPADFDAEPSDELVELDVKAVDRALDTENMSLKVWYFKPGDEMRYHAHREQEEVFYVIEGTFSVILGPPDNFETYQIDPGGFYAAGPDVGHGHRNVGEEVGVMLAIGAPDVTDLGVDPAEIHEG
jgi:quercetin dioxygenase-like cupin family protein